jgi:hypothetical protein
MEHGGSSSGACVKCACACFRTSYICRCGSTFDQHSTGPSPPPIPPPPPPRHSPHPPPPTSPSPAPPYRPHHVAVVPVIETASQRKALGKTDDDDAGASQPISHLILLRRHHHKPPIPAVAQRLALLQSSLKGACCCLACKCGVSRDFRLLAVLHRAGAPSCCCDVTAQACRAEQDERAQYTNPKL